MTAADCDPAVSVVVPTRRRPDLVARAVRSALRQTMADLEVIVVVDGPDDATHVSLAAIDDPRLRVASTPSRGGIGATRNRGVAAARGRWIAFLDDDDEWLETKLAEQCAAAAVSRFEHLILATRLRAHDGSGAGPVWPRRLPRDGEPLSEYLFARSGLRWGETLVHTSTLLVDAALARAVPFDEQLRKHEDLDWLLRACSVPGAGVAFVPTADPLAIWSTDEGRERASTRPDWRASVTWIRSRRGFVTGRAYAAFVLVWVSADAARSGDWAAIWRLPVEAFRFGNPRARDLAVGIGILLTRWRFRRRSVRLR